MIGVMGGVNARRTALDFSTRRRKSFPSTETTSHEGDEQVTVLVRTLCSPPAKRRCGRWGVKERCEM
jgi:hypothetical protein